MSKKSFLKSVTLAIAGVALTSGLGACKMTKHSCGKKHSCKTTKSGKMKCSSKHSCKASKHSCKTTKKGKMKCSSKHSCKSN